MLFTLDDVISAAALSLHELKASRCEDCSCRSRDGYVVALGALLYFEGYHIDSTVVRIFRDSLLSIHVSRKYDVGSAPVPEDNEASLSDGQDTTQGVPYSYRVTKFDEHRAEYMVCLYPLACSPKLLSSGMLDIHSVPENCASIQQTSRSPTPSGHATHVFRIHDRHSVCLCRNLHICPCGQKENGDFLGVYLSCETRHEHQVFFSFTAVSSSGDRMCMGASYHTFLLIPIGMMAALRWKRCFY